MTNLRSAAGGDGVAPDPLGGALAASASPHSPQNLTPGGLGVPQDEHGIWSEEPHSPQNFRPTSFVVPHEAQTVSFATRELYCAYLLMAMPWGGPGFRFAAAPALPESHPARSPGREVT